MKIGITGQSGFIGSHLYNHLGLQEDFQRVPFENDFFENATNLRTFVKQCDVIVHLAAVNRCESEQELYETNIGLVKKLINAIEEEKVAPYLIFSSSSQESHNNLYGKSKQEGRALFETWAKNNNASFSGLIIPNVFGPFGLPYYNSFVATFCHQLTHNEQPKINVDNEVKLIYVGSLCRYIIDLINNYDKRKIVIETKEIPADFNKKVSEILLTLEDFKESYYNQGIIPELNDINEVNLFNTFCCYMDVDEHFPIKLKKSTDNRGDFIETIKTEIGGQFSFSTTKSDITRGNHFHTRKIERFIVIKGKARIQLRKIGTNEVLNFELNGDEPAYADMPIWYTHNITNIGNDDLYTLFWINECYNPEDSDTFYELVEKNEQI